MATGRGTPDWYLSAWSSMKNERSDFMEHWKACQEFVTPRRGRFTLTDRNRGDRRWKSIVNGTGVLAIRKFVAGILTGTAPEAKPWVKIKMHDPALNKIQSVQIWLQQVQMLVLKVLLESNFYDQYPMLIKDAGSFGTSSMYHDDDYDNVAFFQTYACGSYCISNDSHNKIDTFAREFQYTAEQMIGEFGREAVSEGVRKAYDDGNYHAWFTVNHFMMSNPERDDRKMQSKYGRYSSVWYQPEEVLRPTSQGQPYLRQKGYTIWPNYTVRWELEAEDIYATTWPASEALGDITQLQTMEKEKGKGIQKLVAPPLRGPGVLKNIPIAAMPNGVTTYDSQAQGDKLEPVYQVQMPLQEMRIDMDATEKRIDDAFYNDLFMAITDAQGVQPRNQFDLSKRDQERLIQLAPVISRWFRDLLSGVVNRIIWQLTIAKALPVPPQEIQGKPLALEYVSPLMTALQSVVADPIRESASFISGLVGAGFKEAQDKLDVDEAIDRMNEALGAPPSIINDEDTVNATRQARAQQIQQEQQLAAASSVANTAKAASQAQMGPPNEGQNALTAVTGLASGETPGKPQ